MLIKFFPNGKGAGAGPVGYLVAERVLAYDGNRDLIRDADGQPLMVTRDPFPEVLRGELDTIRQDYAASMASQLESFRSDLTGIANDARRIIENDMRRFLNENRSLFETRTEQIRRWLTISPWVISGLIVTGIASMMAASWFWASMLTRSELTELGLTRIDQAEQTWLTLDPARTELKTCTLAGTPVICIKIEER